MYLHYPIVKERNDDAGRMLTATTSGDYSSIVTLTYDEAGRKATESLTVPFVAKRTYTVTSHYNNVNLRDIITYPDGSHVDRSYADLDQLYQINYNNADVAEYTYDTRGRRSTRQLGDTPETLTTWAYRTGDDQVASITVDGVDPLTGANFTYAYDANKNKLTGGGKGVRNLFRT